MCLKAMERSTKSLSRSLMRGFSSEEVLLEDKTQNVCGKQRASHLVSLMMQEEQEAKLLFNGKGRGAY